MRIVTELKVPRRMACWVMIENQFLIWFSQDDPTGVKWKLDRGVVRQPCLHVGCGVGGQVVQHDVDGLALVRLDGLLQEGQEVRAVAGRLAFAVDLAGVPTLSAANRFVVPCRMSSCSRDGCSARPAAGHRPADVEQQRSATPTSRAPRASDGTLSYARRRCPGPARLGSGTGRRSRGSCTTAR